jgi:secreted trypsin-like serine protease
MELRSTKKVALLVATATLLLACGEGNGGGTPAGTLTDTRIINGAVVDQVASPQITKIILTDASGATSLCSGTVLSATQVVTAGHCIVDTSAVKIEIERPDATLVVVAKAVVHPGYVRNLEVSAIFNDIAILETAEPLNLPPLGVIASRPMVVGDSIGIYGYGLDENGEYGILKGGTMTLAVVTPNHLFAPFAEASNTCSGDSGGPATYTLTDDAGNVTAVGIVGITSSGTVADCSKGDVTYFTNLQSADVFNWLVSVVPGVVVQ